MISKIIRNIPDMSSDVSGAIVRDTDPCIHLLEIYHTEGKFSLSFNINWLEHDQARIDWLAQVLGRMADDIYIRGRKDQLDSTFAQLKGLAKIVTDIQKKE